MIDIENLRKSPFSVEEYRNELVNSLEMLQILETTPLSLKEQIDIAKIELEIMNTLFFLDRRGNENGAKKSYPAECVVALYNGASEG